LLVADPEVTDALDRARLDACFDLKRSLANVGRTFDALDRMEASPLRMGPLRMGPLRMGPL
jgi:hypothetical protein